MSNTTPNRLSITRAQLSAAFSGNPQLVLAFEKVLQLLSSPGAVLSTGTILPFGGTIPPDGWLVCDGSAVSIATYQNLFNVIGTTWGSGDGKTTFNLPNMTGRTILGAGPGFPLGSVGGATSETITVANLPATVQTAGSTTLGISSGITGTGPVSGAGQGQPISIMPPYAAATMIIKA